MLALHENERVRAAYRKTWLVFAWNVAAAALLAIAPLALLPLAAATPFPLTAKLPGSAVVFMAALWWWTLWIGSFFAFVNYYLDVLIVTDERIIHIEQHGAFSRTIAELRLERVQDVTVEQHGLLATLLHYGNIRIQTAGETSSFKFFAIPQPMRVKELVMATYREAAQRNATMPSQP